MEEKRNDARRVGRILFGMVMLCMTVVPWTAAPAAPVRLGVLMLGEIREDPLKGLKDGMNALGYAEGKAVVYEVRSADGDRSRLPVLARAVVESRPAAAVACGGVEADALKIATDATPLPVVFLAVASAVERGLVASMQHPGGNLTGVDTNDTALTAKRLWLISRMFPDARRVLIPSIPSIRASVDTVAVARDAASGLGLEIKVIEGASADALRRSLTGITRADADVIYVGMAAPVWQMEKAVLLPVSRAHGIPIMGVDRADLGRGAAAVYAGSRYEAGRQAARLLKKVIGGVRPGDLPAETPAQVEFVINRRAVEALGLNLPRRVWELADEVVSIDVE